jgi:hypothetical protein
MAVSFVAIGTTSTQQGGTTCSPGNPAGIATDDVKYLVYHSRGSATDPTDPASWVEILNEGTAIFGRRLVIWRQVHAGQAAPSVVRAGDSGNDVGTAYVVAFRGVDTTTSENDSGSATFTAQANILAEAGVSDLSVLAGGAVLVAGHKGSNSGANAALLTGDGLTWVEIADATSALGNTLRWAADYALSAGAVTVTDKVFTIGGGPATSDGVGAMIAINPVLAAAAAARVEAIVVPNTAVMQSSVW